MYFSYLSNLFYGNNLLKFYNYWVNFNNLYFARTSFIYLGFTCCHRITVVSSYNLPCVSGWSSLSNLSIYFRSLFPLTISVKKDFAIFKECKEWSLGISFSFFSFFLFFCFSVSLIPAFICINYLFLLYFDLSYCSLINLLG